MTVEVSTLSVEVKSKGIDTAVKGLDDLTASADKAEKATKELAKATDDNGTTTVKSNTKVKNYLKSLEDQVNLLGRNKSETASYIATQRGASSAEIEVARALGAKLDAYKQEQSALSASTKAAKSLADEETKRIASIQKMLSGMEDSVQLYNANNEALNRYKAAMAGATKEEIDSAGAIGRRLDLLQQQTALEKQAASATAQASAEVARTQKANTIAMNSQMDSLRAADMKQKQSTADYIASLKQRADSIGMNKEQLYAYEARLRGATSAQIAEAAAAGKVVDAHNMQADATDKVSKNTSIFHNTLKSMAVAWTAYQLASTPASILSSADAWNNMTARLNIATGSMQEAKAAQAGLFDMSQRIRVPLEDSAMLFSRMSPAIKQMGLTSQDTQQVVESMALALKLNGATAAEASGAIVQFSQAIQSGRLGGQEFNSMAEQAPLVLRAVTAELQRTGELGKITGKELKQLGADGKLSSELLVRSMKNALPEWEAAANKLPDTFDGAMIRLKNAWLKGMGEMGSANGLGTAVANFSKQLESLIPVAQSTLGFLINNIGTLASAVGALLAIKAATWFQDIWINAAKATIAMNANTVALEANAVASTTAGTASAKVSTGLMAITAEAGVARTATTLLGTALNAMGGWVGLAITAVTGLVMAWNAYSNSPNSVEAASKKIRESIQREREQIQENIKELKLKLALQAAGQNVSAATPLTGIDTAKASYIDLNNKLKDLLKQRDDLIAGGLRPAGRFGDPRLTAISIQINKLRSDTNDAKTDYLGFIKDTAAVSALNKQLSANKPTVVMPKLANTFEDQYGLLSKEQKQAYDNMRKTSEQAGLTGKALYEYQAKEVGLTGAIKDRFVQMGLNIDRQKESTKATKSAASEAKKLATEFDNINEKTSSYNTDLVQLTKANDEFATSQAASSLWVNKYADDLDKAQRNVAAATNSNIRKAWQDQVDVLEKLNAQEQIRHVNADIAPKIKAAREETLKYTDALQKQLEAQASQNNRSLAGYGMGSASRESISRMLGIEDDYLAKKRELDDKYINASTVGEKAEYLKQINDLIDFHNKAIAQENDYQSKALKQKQDGWLGAQEAMANYYQSTQDFASQYESLFTNAFKGAEDALTNFFATGKLDVKSFANTVIQELARIQAKQLMASILGGSSGSGGLFGSLLNSIGGFFSGGTSTSDISAMSSNYSYSAGNYMGMRASGGGVSDGGLYRVNEQGTEMFTNNKGEDYLMVGQGGGFVTSNSQLSNQSGDNTPNITYAPVIQIDSRTDQAQIQAMVSNAVKQGNAELVDKLQRQRRI